MTSSLKRQPTMTWFFNKNVISPTTTNVNVYFINATNDNAISRTTTYDDVTFPTTFEEY